MVCFLGPSVSLILASNVPAEAFTMFDFIVGHYFDRITPMDDSLAFSQPWKAVLLSGFKLVVS